MNCNLTTEMLEELWNASRSCVSPKEASNLALAFATLLYSWDIPLSDLSDLVGVSHDLDDAINKVYEQELDDDDDDNVSDLYDDDDCADDDY